MMIPCEVFPRRTANSTELQQLGQALHDFLAQPAPFGGATFGDGEIGAIEDLLAGELPTPAQLRSKTVGRIRSASIIPADEELSDVERATYIGEVVDKARTVAFEINCDDDNWLELCRDRLSELINGDLVTNVIIAGHSWKE